MNLTFPAALFTAAVLAGPALLQAQQSDAPLLPMPMVSAMVPPIVASGGTLTTLPGATTQGPGTKVPMANGSAGPMAALAPPAAASPAASTSLIVPTPKPQLPLEAPAVLTPVSALPGPQPTEPPPSIAAAPTPPPAPVVTLVARINLSTQRMHVSVNGRAAHTFTISSGRSGFLTPRGTFTPGWKAREWFSRQYDDAPMPHAVFFNGGIATHATTATGMLGRPASHGCIRLSPGHAEMFYKLVGRHGLKQTRIIVEGTTPQPAIARRRPDGGLGQGAPGFGSPFSGGSAFVPGPQAYRARPARVVYRAPQPTYGGQAYGYPSAGWGWGGPPPVAARKAVQAPRYQRVAAHGGAVRR